MDFNGIPEETLTFLAELRENNEKPWFDDNRDRYLNDFMEVAKDLVTAMGVELNKSFPGIKAIPKINKSIFRLNRDMRFNSGLPYKSWMGLRFWIGENHPNTCPGFYLQIQPEDIKIGGGMFKMKDKGLDQYRKLVADHEKAVELEVIISDMELNGFQILNQAYKRVPQGYTKSQPSARFLRHVGLYGIKTIPMNETNRGGKMVASSMAEFNKTGPLVTWLQENL